MTPEDLRDYMVGQGCHFAVMMDGGGKVNLYVKSENVLIMSLIHISEPTRQAESSYAVFC